MNILHVIPDLAPETGGPVIAVLGLAAAQAALGHNVSIASTNWGLKESPNIEGIKFHLFPCRYDYWRWSPALRKFLMREVSNYDVVTVESLWQYPTYVAAKACRTRGVPYVVSTNGMLDEWSLAQKAWKKRPYLFLLERATLEGAAAIHATSKGEFNNSHLEGWNVGKLVIPLGINPSIYNELPDQSDFFNRYPALSGKRIVLFLGRLHYKKQPDVAIRAFQRACHDKENTCFVIAGDGSAEYVKYLERLAEDLGVRGNVFFTGLLQDEAVREAYRAATLFILPSWQENFGLSVVEAMAAGCPVIISKQIDLAGDIESAGAGLAVSPNAEENAEAISLLLESDQLRARMGKAGRKLVFEKFTWEKCALSFTEAMEDILAGQKTSSAWN